MAWNVGYWLQKWYKWCRSGNRTEREILYVAWENNRILRDISRRLGGWPTSIRMHFQGVSMPVSLVVGQTVVATATEADAAGVNVPIANPATLTWGSSDETIASSVTNSDGTATFTAVAAGTATASVTDASNGLTTTDTITVTAAPPPVATTIAINFGTPQ